jgi:hypothetical protein
MILILKLLGLICGSQYLIFYKKAFLKIGQLLRRSKDGEEEVHSSKLDWQNRKQPNRSKNTY